MIIDKLYVGQECIYDKETAKKQEETIKNKANIKYINKRFEDDIEKENNSIYCIGEIPNLLYVEFTGVLCLFINDMITRFEESGKAILLPELKLLDKLFLYNYLYTTCEISKLDLSNIDTSNVTSMGNMFGYITLSSLDLSNIDTSNVTDMTGMFYSCKRLADLRFSHFDMSNVTLAKDMFLDCYVLKNVTGLITDLKYSLSLNNSPLLTRESCLVFINGLYDYTSNGLTTTNTLRFHEIAKERLNPEDIAIASDKGWTII